MNPNCACATDARLAATEPNPTAVAAAARTTPHLPTLLALSALAYVCAVAVHEHAGHAAACVLAGSHPTEMGAFYVECDDAHLSAAGRRAVALAGPAASLLLGAAGFALLTRVARSARSAWYFTWLLGSLGLMSAAGYPLFSGVTGLGDLGTTQDGALAGLAPAWLWRIAMTALGVIGYRAVLRRMWHTMAPQLPAHDRATLLHHLRRVALPTYLCGALTYLAIGLLNPHGLEMILLSVLPSSLGGTCGLLVFWRLGARLPAPQGAGPGLAFGRGPAWIGAAAALTLAYAAVFGPTLYL